jgi:hypothetical protein
MATKARTRAKAQPAPEPEDTEDEEMEELGEDEASEEATSKNGSAPAVTFGAKEAAEYLAKKYKTKLDARGLRTLLRKMARDGSGRIEREIKQGTRERYSWTGPDDPNFVPVEKAFKAGELEQDKQEKLTALKERSAAKKAEKVKAKAAAEKKGKTKTKVVEEDDEEDDDE